MKIQWNRINTKLVAYVEGSWLATIYWRLHKTKDGKGYERVYLILRNERISPRRCTRRKGGKFNSERTAKIEVMNKVGEWR